MSDETIKSLSNSSDGSDLDMVEVHSSTLCRPTSPNLPKTAPNAPIQTNSKLSGPFRGSLVSTPFNRKRCGNAVDTSQTTDEVVFSRASRRFMSERRPDVNRAAGRAARRAEFRAMKDMPIKLAAEKMPTLSYKNQAGLEVFKTHMFEYVPAKRSYIYFLILGNSIAYVGQTSSLTNRTAAHLKAKVPFERVLVLPVPQRMATEVELSFIRWLRPLFNTVGLEIGTESEFPLGATWNKYLRWLDDGLPQGFQKSFKKELRAYERRLATGLFKRRYFQPLKR